MQSHAKPLTVIDLGKMTWEAILSAGHAEFSIANISAPTQTQCPIMSISIQQSSVSTELTI